MGHKKKVLKQLRTHFKLFLFLLYFGDCISCKYLIADLQIHHNSREPLKAATVEIQKHRNRIKDSTTFKTHFLGPEGFSILKKAYFQGNKYQK